MDETEKQKRDLGVFMEETITIERMGYGSEAVGRLESGKAVFVEGGAPGDVAALEIVEDKPTFARARIARLVKPSELRVRPRCEAGAACGGCPWQHLSYDAQLEAKRANVAAALERTAKFGRERAEELVRPCLPSKRQWGYRNKLELGAAMDERGTFQLGFHREGAHDIASPGACPLAHYAIAKARKALRGALLALVGALYLRLKSETHALTQSFKLRLLTGQPQLRMLLLQAVKNLGKATMAVGKEVVHRHFKALLPGLELAQQLLLVAADHFRRRGRRRGAQVGDKIGDSDVSLMAYGADDGNRAGKNRPRHSLIVKAP